jgi:hypothetical protein
VLEFIIYNFLIKGIHGLLVIFLYLFQTIFCPILSSVYLIQLSITPEQEAEKQEPQEIQSDNNPKLKVS